jgi:hypothetical protein
MWKIKPNSLRTPPAAHKPAAVLDLVGKMRNERIVRDDDRGLGRWALCIPYADFHALRLRYPELDSPDPAIKYRATMRFLESDESRPYRVHDKRRGRQ